MRFAQDDDVIETLLSDRADHPLDERILPGTRGRGQDLGDAHTRHAGRLRRKSDRGPGEAGAVPCPPDKPRPPVAQPTVV